jgi:predicted cupin superfamily sugar epimerase
VIDRLVSRHRLEPHPEGGYYRRVFEHPETIDGRPLGSAIVYLLPGGVTSRWHRIDAVELWHTGSGAPLELLTSADGRSVHRRVLGDEGEPMLEAPAHAWQCARSLGEWSLVTITVMPAFAWKGFEIAPDGWQPGR